MSRHYESSTLQRNHRYSDYSDGSMGSTQIRRSGSDVSNGSDGLNYLANHLKQTASFDYNENHNSYRRDKENRDREVAIKRNSSNSDNSDYSANHSRNSLENNYSRAMNQMNRGDYGPPRKSDRNHRVEKVNRESSSGGSSSSSRSSSSRGRSKNENTHHRDNTEVSIRSNTMSSDRRMSQSVSVSQLSTASTSKAITIDVKKRSVSKKHPSEEVIALFGAYGVTGRYFMERAIEAGYNVQAMILPGMQIDDYECVRNLRFITGSLEEVDKIRDVVENATYVVCLLNDCDYEGFRPPVGNIANEKASSGYDYCNLNFMHNLVPILEDTDTCRVLLYEASSLSLDHQGTTPVLSTIVKKMAVSKTSRGTKKEQDRIVNYISNQTKNAHFNYIITRPSTSIWDKPSRKKLAASKSQPGPFPITNTDLAEFTLNALKMQKIYNTCPYVVQDGI